MCLLTHEKYKTYQTGFSFGSLGHAHGAGLGGTIEGFAGQKKCPKFNQIWCLSYLHEWHMHRRHFGVPHWGLGEGPIGQISLNLNYKVNFKDF